MEIDITPEMNFKTARSGGKGGQNVNKLETMVIAIWNVETSVLVNAGQKALLHAKLANNINKEQELLVKAQSERTQLANKKAAIKKINLIVNNALKKKKDRLKTKPTKASVEKRLYNKKLEAFKKKARSRVVV